MHMATNIKRWTLEELHSLPDDGNKYELVRGQLFVTPPPNVEHETVLARLSRLLEPILVIEVLSGSTRRRDRQDKRELYAEAGIDG